MAITAKERERQRRALRRELEADAKRKDKERLAALRALVRDARRHKKDRRAEIVRACRAARLKNREDAKGIRARHRMAAALEIEEKRIASRKKCDRNKLRAKHKGIDSVARAAARVAEERRHQHTMRVYSKPPKLGGPKRRRASSVLAESEADVLRNIPDDLVPVWRKVKGKIKATPRKTRTEAFLEWVEAHKQQVYEITDREIQRDIKRLEKEERALRKEYEARNFYARQREEVLRARARRAQLAEVPF